MPDPGTSRRPATTRQGDASPEYAASTGTVSGAPNPAMGGGSSTTESSDMQRSAAAEQAQGRDPEHGLSDEEKQANIAFRERYQASIGRGLSELERERLDLLGPDALGVGATRSAMTAQTSGGQVDHLDAKLSDKELWKRSEAVYLQNNQMEVERAAKFCDDNGLEGLVTVKSGLVGDNANRVAFTEYNPAHPNGFAYVAGQDSPPQIVGLTLDVQDALLRSQIVRVEAEIPDAVAQHVQKTPARKRR